MRSVNTVDDEPHHDDSANFLLSLSNFCKSGFKSGYDKTVATIHNNLEKNETLIMPI